MINLPLLLFVENARIFKYLTLPSNILIINNLQKLYYFNFVHCYGIIFDEV